jgi:hypothetical protein
VKTSDSPAVDVQVLRQAASAYLALDVLPRYEVIKQHSAGFSRDLLPLIDAVERIASPRSDEVVASVAMAGIEEARRRLTVIERAGLTGEHERVKKLAMSVRTLCDHFEGLTGITMCLACDQPIRPGEEDLSYGKVSPSGGATASGRIHADCVNRARLPR